MRMAGPDIVLFVVGALLFSGATAAIVTREGGVGALGAGGSALGIYDVTYSTRTVEGEAAAVASFASHTSEFDVNNTDVSVVTIVIACTDPVPAGSTYALRVEVTAPNNLTVEPQDVQCGAVEIPVEVTPVPSRTTIQGGTAAEARANLGRDANATKALGTWTVTVTGSRGAAPIGLPGPAVPSGSIALKVETWEPTLTPVQK